MKKVIITAIILGLLMSGGVVFAYQYFTSPVDPANKATVAVEIPAGSGTIKVASILKEAGLIKNEQVFRLQLRVNKADDKIQAGKFELSPSYNLDQIIEGLQVAPKQVTITTLPGWRLEEIADYLEKQDLPNFDRVEFLNLTSKQEGQLAANTFQVFENATTEEIVELLTNQFEKDIKTEFADLQAKSGKSWNEILTMASILQREARGLEQMQVVAGLLEKRMEEGMPLQLCATLQYCKGQTSDGKYWNPPTSQDKFIECAYNTYQNQGLPPGPISAVGVDAVEAALTPVESDYYYYIHGDDGQIHYASTNEEHEENIELYLK